MNKQFVFYVWNDPEIKDIIALKKEEFTKNIEVALNKLGIEVKKTVASNSIMAAKKVYRNNPYMQEGN